MYRYSCFLQQNRPVAFLLVDDNACFGFCLAQFRRSLLSTRLVSCECIGRRSTINEKLPRIRKASTMYAIYNIGQTVMRRRAHHARRFGDRPKRGAPILRLTHCPRIGASRNFTKSTTRLLLAPSSSLLLLRFLKWIVSLVHSSHSALDLLKRARRLLRLLASATGR